VPQCAVGSRIMMSFIRWFEVVQYRI
jgi:hypothetical protein